MSKSHTHTHTHTFHTTLADTQTHAETHLISPQDESMMNRRRVIKRLNGSIGPPSAGE